MTLEKKFTEREAGRILKDALKSKARDNKSDSGLTYAELQKFGEEVGLNKSDIHNAVQEFGEKSKILACSMSRYRIDYAVTLSGIRGSF